MDWEIIDSVCGENWSTSWCSTIASPRALPVAWLKPEIRQQTVDGGSQWPLKTACSHSPVHATRKDEHREKKVDQLPMKVKIIVCPEVKSLQLGVHLIWLRPWFSTILQRQRWLAYSGRGWLMETTTSFYFGKQMKGIFISCQNTQKKIYIQATGVGSESLFYTDFNFLLLLAFPL